jgi:tRNA modification GTPase
VIEAHLAISGIPVIIADTAGIRDGADSIEKEGIRRSLIKSKEADLKLLVLDVFNLNDPKIIDLIDQNTLILINKIDIGSVVIPEIIQAYQPISISLKENINLKQFLSALEQKVQELASPGQTPLITRARYRQALSEAMDNLKQFSLQKNVELAAEDLRLALRAVGKITGKVAIDDILDIIFSGFCIGK